MIAEGVIIIGSLCFILGIVGFLTEYLPEILKERAEKRRKPVSQKGHSYMDTRGWY